MRKKEKEKMVSALANVILNNDTFPDPKSMRPAKLGVEAQKFIARYHPKRNLKFTNDKALEFMKRNNIFGIFSDALSDFHKKRKVCIIVDGADATGKTSLVNELAKRLNCTAFENKSYLLFSKMFGMSPDCKTAVVNYNKDPLIGMVFYCVSNALAMLKVVKSIGKSRFVIVDSSMLRTIASHVAPPDMSMKSDNKMHIGKKYREFCLKLNDMALKALVSNRTSVVVIFMYMSEKARQEQVKSRKYADAYDTSTNYARTVSEFLKISELYMKKKKANALSITVGAAGENVSYTSSKSDVFLDRTHNRKDDVAKKVNAVVEYLTSKGFL